MPKIVFEVCANSLSSALAARDGGAHRIELCSSLNSGGLTPSAGTIKSVLSLVDIPVFVLIRPRAGDFLYSRNEFNVMKEDIKFAKNLGAAGVVFGILNPEAGIDVDRCSELVSLAKPMQSTFHRAFDRVMNPGSALEDVIKTGAQRVLTSGLNEKAVKGKEFIRKLVEQANGRIAIMAGRGINPQNVAEIVSDTGVKEIHASCSASVYSKMIWLIRFSSFDLDYCHTVTNACAVRKMLDVINKVDC
ncbi:MAG TPA: copper homeostasis protein CutC [Bacteroidales bacterium]|nr:copper homeostasis protein CutC [Bacteroidales bacterium]